MDALARISRKRSVRFGIMKKKAVILAHPMTRHYEGDCESVVKVCACLYNMTRPDPTRRAPERNGVLLVSCSRYDRPPCSLHDSHALKYGQRGELFKGPARTTRGAALPPPARGSNPATVATRDHPQRRLRRAPTPAAACGGVGCGTCAMARDGVSGTSFRF